MSETEKAIENLNTAKLILCNPQMLTPEMYIRIGQAITDVIALLKEREAVKPKYKERMGGFVAGLCPTCGAALNNVLNAKACGKCGQAVKWE